MMWKLSERSAVGGSTWLTGIMTTAPSQIQPPKEPFRMQRMDTKAALDHDVIAAGLKKAFAKLLKDHGDAPGNEERAGSDGDMAVVVHRAFAGGLTLREASDPGLWAWFTVFAVPDYVRWRWPTKSQGALAGRMAGNIKRNALARLWWWAEATFDPEKDEDDLVARYAITRNVTDRQDLVLWCGDCAFAGKREIVRSLDAIQASKTLGSRSQQLLCRYVNRMLRTVCIDALPDEQAVRAACERAFRIGSSKQARE